MLNQQFSGKVKLLNFLILKRQHYTRNKVGIMCGMTDLGLARVISRFPGRKAGSIHRIWPWFPLDIMELQQSDCDELPGNHGPLRKDQGGQRDLGYHQALGVQGNLWVL